ncbi:12442_t:CDS:2 [Funneliformis mosseae]|uniref:12442_t:CDS:1 n=2 Tax=Funneliformis TaxID=1117308 RepID=A0A9N9DFJ9_FUNMO|nr:12442_t:CDS:2 [Funneliformis mosseae]
MVNLEAQELVEELEELPYEEDDDFSNESLMEEDRDTVMRLNEENTNWEIMKTSLGSEKKRKREPNMFISYRKEMMERKPPNMSMTKYSKLVSYWWRKIPENEKAERKRQYQINRDQKATINGQ